jgi:tRNA pseudouridine(38-40) synthase
LKSGVAKQTNSQFTIHNVIESILKRIGEENNYFKMHSHVKISSRTDAGVHAFANTGHFDLLFDKSNEENVSIIEPANEMNKNLCELIKKNLNKQMLENNFLIRYCTKKLFI